MPTRRVTQVDVARAAGVSRSTVSLVINGRDRGRIPAATRQRVLDAMHELDYHPNWAARMLVQRRNRVIGVFTYEPLFPYEEDDFFYPFVLGIERQATHEGYHLLLFTRGDSASKTPGIYREDGDILSMVDGTILMGRHPDPKEIRRLVREARPFVYIGKRHIPGCDFDWVSNDYRQGAFEVATRVLRMGHTRLGYVGPERRDLAFVSDRIAGCRDAVGADGRAKLHLLDWEAHRSRAQLVPRVRQHRLTALICNSNETLHEVRHALLGAGLGVPDDISLASLSDDRVALPCNVEPSGIHLNRAKVGEEALRMLIQRLHGLDAGPFHRLVPCSYRQGNTLAPAPRHNG